MLNPVLKLRIPRLFLLVFNSYRYHTKLLEISFTPCIKTQSASDWHNWLCLSRPCCCNSDSYWPIRAPARRSADSGRGDSVSLSRKPYGAFPDNKELQFFPTSYLEKVLSNGCRSRKPRLHREAVSPASVKMAALIVKNDINGLLNW